MSLVIINRYLGEGRGPYQAIRDGHESRGLYPWSVIVHDGNILQDMPLAYRDDEVTRIPAHLGQYDEDHWGERNPKYYASLARGGYARYRAEGEAR